MEHDYDALGLTELIKLQDDIGRVIRARFERERTLVFADVVGSTTYFERFGAAAGRALLQRFLDLLAALIKGFRGRVVDTAGDGAFCVFANPLSAVLAMSELMSAIARENREFQPEHQLSLRVGIHHAPVLTDGELVTGEAVNMAARIGATARINEIRISHPTRTTLPPNERIRCKGAPPVQLKGIADPVDLYVFEWRDPARIITRIRFEETGQEVAFPPLERVRFGRLKEHNGRPANEVVLAHPSPDVMRRISRWQFEVLQVPDGYQLKSVSRAATSVDGQDVTIGETVPVGPGSEVLVSSSLRLTLLCDAAPTDQPETMLETVGV